jgi:hypothetical protein
MYIHLKSQDGLFNVVSYNKNYIKIRTNRRAFTTTADDFSKMAGGHWNSREEKSEIEKFLKVINAVPETPLPAPAEVTESINSFREMLNFAEDMKDAAREATEHLDDALCKIIKQDDVIARLKEDLVVALNAKVQQSNSSYRIVKTCYKDFDVLSAVKDFQTQQGTKFIFQEGNDSYRIRFDVFDMVSNMHSEIDRLFRSKEWHTVSGGWIKIIDNVVYLYYESGDFGVYDEAKAVKCAQELYPDKEIKSFAGKPWWTLEKEGLVPVTAK